MDALDQFANEAARFCRWARKGVDPGPGAAHAALQHIVHLYAAGLALPPESITGCSEDHNPADVPADELRAVASACAGLPLDIYWEVFDPTEDGAEPVAGSLTDDISDIYKDVARGLTEYESGRRSEAHWQWSFHLRHHWGAHATGAIRALQWWCSEEGSDPGQ